MDSKAKHAVVLINGDGTDAAAVCKAADAELVRRVQVKNRSDASLLDAVPALTSFANTVKLVVHSCPIASLPLAVFRLQSLRSIVLQDTRISEIPDCMQSLEHLEELKLISCSELTTLPPSIGALPKLRLLCMHLCRQMTYLPGFLADAASLTHIVASNCGLADGVDPMLAKLPILHRLNVSDNALTSVPIIPSLRELNLERNEIRQIPPSVVTMQQLRVLRIGGNPLCGDDAVRSLAALSQQLDKVDVRGTGVRYLPYPLALRDSGIIRSPLLDKLRVNAFPAAPGRRVGFYRWDLFDWQLDKVTPGCQRDDATLAESHAVLGDFPVPDPAWEAAPTQIRDMLQLDDELMSVAVTKLLRHGDRKVPSDDPTVPAALHRALALTRGCGCGCRVYFAGAFVPCLTERIHVDGGNRTVSCLSSVRLHPKCFQRLADAAASPPIGSDSASAGSLFAWTRAHQPDLGMASEADLDFSLLAFD